MKFKEGDRVWFHAGGHPHDTGIIFEVVEPNSYRIRWDKEWEDDSVVEEGDIELTTKVYDPNSNPFRM